MRGQFVIITLPLEPEHWAELKVRVPMREAEWARLLTVLGAMRPALVLPDDEAPPP